jgi:DNA primase
MPRIRNEEEIKRRADIEGVIGRRVRLLPARGGSHLEGSCPFHSSRSGRSFHVNPERGGWYCFGCSEGGSLADFLMKFEGCDYREALEIMAAESGVAVEYDDAPAAGGGDRPQATRQQVLQALEAACRVYQAGLEDNEAAREYLAKRGFGRDVVERWRFGYACGSSVAKAAPQELLVAAGVLRLSERTGSAYDPLAGRITVPVCDHSGRVLGFAGRLVEASADRPKYLNTGDTAVFRKGRTLFGVREARELLRRDGRLPLHVLEGQLKAVACAEAGIPAVAAGGTAFTPEQAVVAVGLSERIAWCPDPDEAGTKAVLANAPVLREKGAEVVVGELEIPDSVTEPVKDPDDLRAMGLPVRYQYYGLVDWLYYRITGGRRTEAAVRDVVRLLLPVIGSHPEKAIRWMEMRKLAELSGIPESEWGASEMPKAPEVPSPREVPAEAAVDPSMPPDRLLLAVLLQGGRSGWEAAMPWSDLPQGLVAALAQVSHILRLSESAGIPVADAAGAVADGAPLAYYRYWLSAEAGGRDPSELARLVAADHRRRMAARAAGAGRYAYAQFLDKEERK